MYTSAFNGAPNPGFFMPDPNGFYGQPSGILGPFPGFAGRQPQPGIFSQPMMAPAGTPTGFGMGGGMSPMGGGMPPMIGTGPLAPVPGIGAALGGSSMIQMPFYDSFSGLNPFGFSSNPLKGLSSGGSDKSKLINNIKGLIAELKAEKSSKSSSKSIDIPGDYKVDLFEPSGLNPTWGNNNFKYDDVSVATGLFGNIHGTNSILSRFYGDNMPSPIEDPNAPGNSWIYTMMDNPRL